MDPEVSLEVRRELKQVFEEANREEEGKPFRLIITEFEVTQQ